MTAEEYANIYLENEIKIIENSDRKIVVYLEAFFNNEIICEPFFISTSRSIFVGNQFGNVHFEIFCRTGKNIERIAKHPLEKEILLSNNAKFRVVIPNGIKEKIKLIEI